MPYSRQAAHKCKLVQDILETETLVQLHNPFFSQTVFPVTFPVSFSEKQYIQTSLLFAFPFFSVYSVCLKRLIICLQRLNFKTRKMSVCQWRPHQRVEMNEICVSKVRKAAKIRNRYNQVPHLTQDTTWAIDKNTI